MDGDTNVQNGVVSTPETAETASTTTTVSAASSQEQGKEAEPAKQPLTVEALQKLLAEQQETSRRAIQSVRDSLTAEVNKLRGETAIHAQKARTAEGTLRKVKERFQEDPETEKEVRLAELEAKEQLTAEQQQQWEATQRAQAVDQQFYQDMGESLRMLGVDAMDKRIDWAVGVPDYKQRMMKIMASAKTILKHDVTTREKKMEQSFKEEMAQLRKELGIDKTSTAGSQAASSNDKEFMEKWGSGELPATKSNLERARKLSEA